MNKKFLKKIKEKLENGKVTVEEELRAFAKKDKNLPGDWDTRFPKFGSSLETAADEVEEYTTLLPIEFELETKLKNIDSALEKIKKNKYGKCEACDKNIEEKRLKAYPEAKSCMKCK